MTLSLYTDLTKTTGSLIYSGVEDVVNDAVRTNMGALHYLWRGQDMPNIVQGGRDISDTIYLSYQRRTVAFSPNDPQVYTLPQTLTNWSVKWRERLGHMAYVQEEIILNSGSGDARSRAQQIKNRFTQLERDTATETISDLDDTLWAVPDTTKMEAATGKEPMSIPFHVNEFSNGVIPAAFPGGAGSTKQGIDPTTAGQTNWKPYQQTYANLTVPIAANGLIIAFDKSMHSTEFTPPPMKEKFFEPGTNNAMRVVFTSMKGRVNLMQILRLSNDRWQETEDPATGFWNLKYRGIPIVYCRQLDTAQIFPTDTGGAPGDENDTDGTTNAGPRYFGINAKYLRPVVHKDLFFKDLGEMKRPEQPTTCIHPILTMTNLVASSLARHFIIYPSADITSY